MFRSRRGLSYIAEASLIYPVIIAVTVMMLAAAVYLYGLTADCSDLNRIVRRSAGEKSFTVYYSEVDTMRIGGIPAVESGGLLQRTVSAETDPSFVSRIVFRMRHQNVYKAEASVISEASILWDRQAVKNAVDSIAGKE